MGLVCDIITWVSRLHYECRCENLTVLIGFTASCRLASKTYSLEPRSTRMYLRHGSDVSVR